MLSHYRVSTLCMGTEKGTGYEAEPRNQQNHKINSFVSLFN